MASVGGRRHQTSQDENVDMKSDIAIRADSSNVMVHVNVIMKTQVSLTLNVRIAP